MGDFIQHLHVTLNGNPAVDAGCDVKFLANFTVGVYMREWATQDGSRRL